MSDKPNVRLDLWEKLVFIRHEWQRIEEGEAPIWAERQMKLLYALARSDIKDVGDEELGELFELAMLVEPMWQKLNLIAFARERLEAIGVLDE